MKIELPFTLPGVTVLDVATDTSEDIIITVETTETSTACRLCKKQLTKRHGSDKSLKLRHTAVFATPTYIIYKPHRYICDDCDNTPTTTATPTWHKQGSHCTLDYENNVLLSVINSTIADVSMKEQLSESVIYGIIDRHVESKIDWTNIHSLGVIGIDEVSLKKGHGDYVTIVTCRHEKKIQLLALIKGREKAKIKQFLQSIPSHLKKTIKAVCTDMYDGYVNAAREIFRNEKLIIIDRYHVAKLYRKTLDKFRQREFGQLKQSLSKHEYKKIKGAMHILRKKNECLTKQDKQVIEKLFFYSPDLKEAYSLSIKLTQLFNTQMTKAEALVKMNAWIKKVKCSHLTCFNSFVKTLKKYKNMIANYFIDRNTSGFVEGLNNKVKVLKRRCYGIFNLKHLFQRLHLNISGYRLLLGKSAC